MKPHPVCAAWLCVAAQGLPAAAQVPCAQASVAALVQQVNHVRAQGADCGARGRFAPAAALGWHPALESVARAQAQWLADYGLLLHTGSQGQTLGQRASAAGYRYARVTENLAKGQSDVAAALRAWTASEGHCVNLYDAGVNEMALACAPGADGRALWVLVMGRLLPPAAPAPAQ